MEDIFNYVTMLRQQSAQKDQIIKSLENQIKELQQKKTEEKK